MTQAPQPTRLINLTGADLHLDTVPYGHTVVPGSAAQATAAPRRDDVTLDTDHGPVTVRTLRTRRDVAGLPAPFAGVHYVVSPVVAHLRDDRDDLLFPTSSPAHSDAVVVLGRWAPHTWWPRHRQRWRDWRQGRRVSTILTRPDWVIAVLFSVGMAALGAAGGIIPDLAATGWHNEPARTGWFVRFSVLAVAALAVGALMWKRRNQARNRRGTAYLIEEIGPQWTFEDKRSFLNRLTDQYARVLYVPGPAELGTDWTWPLDHDTYLWEQRLDQLVASFWATYYNDDHTTANAVYAWASWPVAVGFGARAVAGRRGLTLHIRQRPSFGRSGALTDIDFDTPGHTFHTPATSGGIQPTGAVSVHDWTFTIHRQPTQASPSSVPAATVLLVRVLNHQWGPLPHTSQPPPPAPTAIVINDGAGIGLADHGTVTVREWRYTTLDGRVPWQEYPYLVEAITDWICAEANADPHTALLISTLVPQEISLGLGIRAAHRHDWPTHLWPLVHSGERDGMPAFTVPRLDLGQARP